MSGEKVLIVEDDDFLQVTLADSLARLGYTIIEAGTGNTAHELIAQELPDLILLDLRLPGMDGLSVAKKLNEHPKRRYPRFNVEIGAICRLRGRGNQAGTGRIADLIRNLSEEGVMLELVHPSPPPLSLSAILP